MKFKDVTNEKGNVTFLLKSNLDKTKFIRVFECGDTGIIYSSSENRKHVSISNTNRHVKNSEMKYAIKRIMKTKVESVEIYLSNSGVIHIHEELL